MADPGHAQIALGEDRADPAAFGQLIQAEITQWADVVKRSKIKAD